MHLHTIGGAFPDFSKFPPKVGRAAFATVITSFQMYMAVPLMAMIFAGVLEHHPGIRMVIGESGIGWMPYILDHMDLEWEDQFKDLDLKMKPSDYWHRQCYATYQSDRIGIKMLDEIGEDNIMWGSTSRIPTASGRIPRNIFSAKWAICPSVFARRSFARTPPSFTVSVRRDSDLAVPDRIWRDDW